MRRFAEVRESTALSQLCSPQVLVIGYVINAYREFEERRRSGTHAGTRSYESWARRVPVMLACARAGGPGSMNSFANKGG